jgi:hypothetical protein
MKETGKLASIEPPVFDAEGYQVNLTTLNGERLPNLNDGSPLFVFRSVRGKAHWKQSGGKPVPPRLKREVARMLRTLTSHQRKRDSAVSEKRRPKQ